MDTNAPAQPATTVAPLPPADLLVSPTYYETLAGQSDDAEADHKLVMRQYREREEALHAQLHPKVWEAVIALVEARDAIADHQEQVWVAELKRHLPGIAPAIEVVWQHLQEVPRENIGWCCAGEGCIEEIDGGR